MLKPKTYHIDSPPRLVCLGTLRKLTTVDFQPKGILIAITFTNLLPNSRLHRRTDKKIVLNRPGHLLYDIGIKIKIHTI